MRVNPTTMLYENLSAEEVEVLYEILRDQLLTGKIIWNHSLIDQWMKVCAANSTQKLLMIFTAFPARALLSIVEYYREKQALIEDRQQVTKSIQNCTECNQHRVISDPDPYDSFCSDDIAVLCLQTKNPDLNSSSIHVADKSSFRAVVVGCRPYSYQKQTKVPDWCPKKR